MSAPALPAAGRPAAIVSPLFDLLAVGGLSIVLLVPLLLSGRDELVFLSPGAQAWFLAVVNMPHFMISYRLVYRDRATILKHKWASIGVPAILIVWIGLALWEAQWSNVLVTALVVVSSGYLAWHYTGQVWGMMASFAHLGGSRFDDRERLLIRGSLRFLLVWHLTWFVHTQVRAFTISPFYWAMTAGTLLAFAAGLAGMASMRRRTGSLPPARAIVAWAAIFVWYAAMARDPKAIFWVQLAHAFQYLEFPFRVELNRTLRRKASGAALHMIVFAVLLWTISIVMVKVVPSATMNVIAEWLGDEPALVTPVLILSFINVHHYFTDGVIWKLRNPEVRQDLFAHVPATVSAAPAAGGGNPAGAPGKVGSARKGRRR